MFKYSNASKGRNDEYLLKRPNVFVGSASDGVLKPGDRILAINNNNTSNLSHVDANNLFKRSGTSARLEIGRSDPNTINTHQTDMSFQNHPDLQKVHSQAKNVLSSHLKTLIHSSEETSGRDSNHDVALQNQPYRTLPLVLPNPKTIHDCVGSEKNYCTSSLERNPESQPYRTASLVMPGPKTINEMGAGAPTYKPYRGPQYTVNNQHKFGATQSGQYNSPEHLYNEESLAKTPRINQGVLHLPTPGNATNSKQHESETFKIVLESEMDGTKTQHGIVGRSFEKLNHGGERPTSQLSDRSYRTDPVLNNTSINQSASFKKLMHSVLGESEF